MKNDQLIAVFKAEHPDEYAAISATGADAARAEGHTAGIAAEKGNQVKSGAVVHTKADFITAFGETDGLVMYGKDMTFVDSVAAHNKKTAEAHAAALNAEKVRADAAEQKLASMDRGNDAVTHQAEPKDGKKVVQAAKTPERTYENGAKFGDAGAAQAVMNAAVEEQLAGLQKK